VKATLDALQRTYGGNVRAYGVGGVMISWGPYGFFIAEKTETGECRIAGDDFSAPIKLEQFKALFQQQYYVQAVAMAMRRMGYQASQIPLQNKSVLVRGIRAGGVYV